ncbi:hypothetical protein [Cryobacterium sp. Hb1]|uniref:hypothetical protein n=1 Tax=Cryobacterium sp. Hb1 TaxID=1259147 RepID=UPI00106987CD|nr:hypothetical protein [Cryobacterium sp. Hb1]TFD72142.1 hypothetical protein E3T38_01210 [Cryobacterium sp. Hb1]
MDAMLRLLPRRCRLHGQRHWTARDREACRQAHLDKRQADIERKTKQQSVPREPAYRREERKWKERRRAAAIAAHVGVPSTIHEEMVVDRNGERQLFSLFPKELDVVGVLTSLDVFPANKLLRNGMSLNDDGGLLLDGYPYETQQTLVDAAVDLFFRLDTALDLDEPIRLYRGLGLFVSPNQFDPDVAGLSAYLHHGTPWDPVLRDLGFGFACTNPKEALRFGRAQQGSSATLQVLFELEADRGLCIPKASARSRNLFQSVYDIEVIKIANAQVIFPPGTEWEIVEAPEKSEHIVIVGGKQLQVPLVRMKQVA